MSDVELPIDQAKAIFERTAVDMGYHSTYAGQLAQSAHWLENRGFSGVRYLIVYLIMVQNMPMARREPRRNPQGEVRSICPILAAHVYLNMAEKQGFKDDPIKMQGPAAPLLSAPILSFHAARNERLLHLKFQDQSLYFSKDEVAHASSSVGGLFFMDLRLNHVTEIAFPRRSEVADLEFRPMVVRETLSLPRNRLVRNHTRLDLTNRPNPGLASKTG